MRTQASSEAVAERLTQGVLVLGRVSSLMGNLLGNLTMMDRCATHAAKLRCWTRVVELSEAIGLLLPRLHGELGAAPFHLDAIALRDTHLRLIDVALRRVSVAPSWEHVQETQALLDQAYPQQRYGVA